MNGVSSARREGADRSGCQSKVAPVAVLLSVISFALLCSAACAGEQDVDPGTGYRVSNYRAPVPQTVPGGTVISLDDFERMELADKPVVIDVMAAEGAGADPATGVWHLAKPHRNKAGSIWLADVGRGVLTPRMAAYFRENLAKFTGGDKARPIIIYCQADCWMSWNAVKRAASYGYTALFWYPDGTDGMRDWDVQLVEAIPVAMPPQTR